MTDKLLTEKWIETFAKKSRLVIAYSGGLDSSVLLHALVTYFGSSIPIVALHVNHGISPNADRWEQHCQSYCDTLNIPLITYSVSLTQGSNIENEAREARYQVFQRCICENDALLLGHHALDQVETLFLNLLRGSGLSGLAAMPAVAPIGEGEMYRPFLHHYKETLEAYANEHQITYIEDESNADIHFNRNYIRHELLPVLRKRWPALQETVLRTVSHCQEAERNLQALARYDYSQEKTAEPGLSITLIEKLPYERQVNLLRYWLREQKVRFPSQVIIKRILKEVVHARSDALPLVQWADTSVRRYQNYLYLVPESLTLSNEVIYWDNFPEPCEIKSLQKMIKVINPPADLLHSGIRIQYRKGGEYLYWRGHQRSLKKLMQEWQISPWQRTMIPLVYAGSDLVAVVGYAVSDHLPETCQFFLN